MAPQLLDLELLLEAGDSAGVEAFFRGMPEQQRQLYGDHVASWSRRLKGKDSVKTPRGELPTRPLFIAAKRALMCAASYSELTKAPLWDVPHGDEAYEILIDRRPDWLEKWATHLLGGERHWLDWVFVRRLVREGLVPRPDHPNYALGMIGGLICWQPGYRPSVRQRFLEDPDLLEHEVWGIFEHEGSGDNCLSGADKADKDGWSRTLADYAKASKLDRARLLACCMEALSRDYNHFRAKWFSAFYDLLEPTQAENHGYAQAFLSLLGVSAPNIVGWAFKKVQAQVKAKRYSAEELVAGLKPALEARSKATVKSALKLLANVAKDAPQLRVDVAKAALIALAHPEAAAQAAALDVIEACATGKGAPPSLIESIGLRSHAELVAPSLRARLEALLGDDAGVQHAAPTEVHSVAAPGFAELPADLRRLFAIDELLQQPQDGLWTLPAARFDGTDLPRLAPLQLITPINDLEELIDVAARVIEDAVGPDDVERVLDGVARLADQRPADFERRTAPLLKRIEQLFERKIVPFVGAGPAADVSGLLHAWITGGGATFRTVKLRTNKSIDVLKVRVGQFELDAFTIKSKHILGTLSKRAHQISLHVAKREAHQLLSAPSHTGCLLDPKVLAERVTARADIAPDSLDAAIAMLRCAPEHRTEALQILDAGPGGGGSTPQASSEWYQAIRHALGGDVPVPKTAKTVSLWAAAARARAPWSVDKAVSNAFPVVGPDVGDPALYEVSFTTDEHKQVSVAFSEASQVRGVDLECIPVVLNTERGEHRYDRRSLGESSDSGIRWAATLWPIARESYFAAAFTHIAHNIDWWVPSWAAKTLLEPLLDSGTPLREMGLLLLCAGLGAKEPGEHGLATDAAIHAISDGRLGSDNLGRGLALLLGSGMIKPPRWAKTLGDVARASDAHAAVIKLALEACLPALAEPPRDFVKLLELLHELSAQLGHGVAGAGRAPLEAVKGGNKVAKLAKAILAVPAVDSPALRLATRSLTEMRVEAAQRWV